MTKVPDEYRGSSYRCNAMGKEDRLVTGHDLYQHFGLSDEQRQDTYQALFQDAVANELLTTIRDATNKGWALGNNRFRIQIEAIAARRAAPLSKGRPNKIDSDP